MKKISFIIAALVIFSLAPSCQHHADDHDHDHMHEHEHDHDHGHDHEHHHGDNTIHFTNQQGRKGDFALEKIAPQPFGQVIKATAQVLPSQGDEREATATASGVVIFTNSNLVEGVAVKAGQPLFEIDGSGMADNNMSVRFQEAAARYNAAKAAYERKQRLAEDKIVSQTDLDQAQAEYTAAKAAYDNLKANFSQRGAIVRAPISGYIQRINVNNGGFVEAGRSVVTVSQNRDLLLRAEVQPRYYSALSHIAGVNVVLPNSTEAVSLQSLQGSLVSYGRATDADCPLLPVTFRVRNDGQLLSGTFVTLYIATEGSQEAITIPNQGIVEEMGSYFVFVKVCEEEYEKRLVTIGATDGLRTEITSGLQAGDIVVSRGAFMVKLAQGAGALDPHAGHVH